MYIILKIKIMSSISELNATYKVENELSPIRSIMTKRYPSKSFSRSFLECLFGGQFLFDYICKYLQPLISVAGRVFSRIIICKSRFLRFEIIFIVKSS